MSDPASPAVAAEGLPGIIGAPAGLIAVPDTADGTPGRDRRGRVKYGRVYLTAANHDRTVQPGSPVPEVDERDLTWFTATATRRWATVRDRFGDRAERLTHLLCSAGVLTVHTSVTAELRLDVYRSIRLTQPWWSWRTAHVERAAKRNDEWTRRARAAAARVGDLDPGLADALQATGPSAQGRLPVLVHVAEALADGTWFDGPRAFSQTFFGDSKARDDAPALLLAAGASPTTLSAIGLTRSAYIGAGGPLVATGHGRQAVDLTAFAGPIRFRTDPPLRFTPRTGTTTLAIIENLQAAEAICDQHPDLAVLWCAGQPSNQALHLMAETAHGLDVIIAPDADLGGARIAHRIATHLPDDVQSVTVLDAGAIPHPKPTRQFGAASMHALRSIADTDGPAAELARACLARGYRVEQEAVIRAAISSSLTGWH